MAPLVFRDEKLLSVKDFWVSFLEVEQGQILPAELKRPAAGLDPVRLYYGFYWLLNIRRVIFDFTVREGFAIGGCSTVFHGYAHAGSAGGSTG